jgi:hypothetical protein
MSDQNNPESTKRFKRGLVTWALGILLFAALAGCGGLYWQYHKAADKDPQSQQQKWITDISSVMVAPDETPVITTVLDKTKLTNQSLAAVASNGDRLYIYSKAKRLILYRPSLHKVVDMLTIQTQDAAEARQTSATQTATQTPVTQQSATTQPSQPAKKQ